MDSTRRKILGNVRESVVSDLEVEFILDSLYKKAVVDKRDVDRINAEATGQDKTRVLLDILEGQKDNVAFDNFAESLKKDYSWLYDGIRGYNENEGKLEIEEQKFEDAIILGDLPRLPSHYIDRTDILQDLRTKLRSLRRGGRIVLSGMTGSGKSCLVAAAVRDRHLLSESFNNKLFWFNLGEIKTDEQILRNLYRLNQRLTNEINSNSIVASNALGTSYSIESMRDFLKNKVASSSPFSQALLILDNICSKKIISAFDIGCKMIITTQDLNHVVDDQNTTFIQMSGGFTEEETLTLFAKSLDTTLEAIKQRPEARKISSLCKGQPMLIDLIGTLFKTYKESLLKSSDQWDYYIQMLSRKDSEQFSQIYGAIDMCINTLSEKYQISEKYKDFVIFVEDVNIMPEVLSILWDINLYDLQHIMHELENKSLIVSYYNQDKQTYIYGVHDLLLARLKRLLSSEEIKNRHHKLISAYKRICNGDYANLPNDNYIYQYIGYHLQQAKLYSEFTNIYFDLNFIGAKIKATGIADLLKDFEVYEKYITNNDKKLKEKLEMYKKFVEVNGQDLHKYQDTDIIQCGLQQRSDTAIYMVALKHAESRPNSLYFKLQAPQENHYYTHTLDLQEDFNAACFTRMTSEILVGTRTGNINLWDQTYNQMLCTFQGHTDSITQLQLSPNKDEFLSVSEDGTVKLWRLQLFNRNSNGFMDFQSTDSEILPSPRLKQAGHQTFFGTELKVDHCKTFDIEDPDDRLISASFSNYFDTSRRIVTGSQKGKIVVWNVDVDQEKDFTQQTPLGDPASCVGFSWNDDIVITASGSNICLFDAVGGGFLSKLFNKVPINSLLIVPYEDDHTIVAINDSLITMWTWDQLDNRKGVHNPAMKELYRCEETKLTCGAVTEDGAYLVVASTDHYTRMWNISTGSVVEDFFNKTGLVISLDTFYEDNNNSVHILLSGSDDKTVKQLHVYPEIMDKKESKNLPIFDTFWNQNSVHVAAANTKNTVQILNGRTLQKESEEQNAPIKRIAFSKCGEKVAYGMECGNVEEFDLMSGHKSVVMTLHSPITFLKYFDVGESSRGSVGRNGDGSVGRNGDGNGGRNVDGNGGRNGDGNGGRNGDGNGGRNGEGNEGRSIGRNGEGNPGGNFDWNDEGSTRGSSERSSGGSFGWNSEGSPVGNFGNNGQGSSGGSSGRNGEGSSAGSFGRNGDGTVGGNVNFLHNIPGNVTDQLLVAASEDGTLMTHRNGRAFCFRKPPQSPLPNYKVPIIPIVQSFFIKSVHKLLTISRNRSVLLWDLVTGGYSVLLGDKGVEITMAVLSHDETLMAITLADGSFEVYCLQIENGFMNAVFSQGKNLEIPSRSPTTVPLRSCAISFDRKYLALGRDNGSIEIWSLESKSIFATLPLHKCWVRYLAFSPSPELILISVSDQIAWWDINKIPIDAQNKSRSFRRRSNSLKKNKLSLNLLNPSSSSMNMTIWGNKQGPPKKPHLLSAIKLHGLHANSISASPDFTSFFTVDNNGEFYIMELLSPHVLSPS